MNRKVWKGLSTVNQRLVFFCGICGYCSNRSSHVNTHVRRHTGEKPYACFMCHYQFADRSNWRKHCQVYHGVIVGRRAKYAATQLNPIPGSAAREPIVEVDVEYEDGEDGGGQQEVRDGDAPENQIFE